ncbi:clumping factor B, partial [Amycolatopsis antarctica]
MTERDVGDGGPADDLWQEVHESQDFRELKRRLRVFVFPMTGLFLVWYLLYVLLADYAHGFMSTKVVGN